jgi:hypothetical protein
MNELEKRMEMERKTTQMTRTIAERRLAGQLTTKSPKLMFAPGEGTNSGK